MYVDKPMRGHGLMQAIARVNRVFKDKPGGLVVDYLGLADELKRALATYTESGGTGRTAIDQSEAVALMLEKYEVCLGLFHGFGWARWMHGTPQQRLSLLPLAQEHVHGRLFVLQAPLHVCTTHGVFAAGPACMQAGVFICKGPCIGAERHACLHASVHVCRAAC